MRLYVLGLALVGCAQGSPVKGHFVKRYPSGATVPIDLRAFNYQVYVENGDGYDRYPAEPVFGTEQGTFEIADVPDGPFWVRASNDIGAASFRRRDQHDYVETFDVLGRPDDAPATMITPLMVDATGLAPWADADGLTIDCFENATETADPTLMPALAAGDQAIHSQLDWADRADVASVPGFPLKSLMRAGDHVTISRSTLVQQTPVEISALTQVLTADAPAQVDGQPGSIAGAFVDVPRDQQLAIAVDLTHLQAPPGPLGRWAISSIAGPGTAKGIAFGPGLFDADQATSTQPVPTTVSFGNPFDPTWTPRLYAELYDLYPMGAPTGQYAVASEDLPLPAGTYTFEPLPPPGNPTIAGAPIASTIMAPQGISLPLDATLPDGTSLIHVEVWMLRGTGIPADDVGSLITDRMPIELPADLFQSGRSYTFEITAYVTDSDRNRSSTAFTGAMTYNAQ